MRLKTKFQSFMSSTTAGEKDLGNEDPAGFSTDDSMSEAGTHRYVIADSTSNQNVTPAVLAEVKYIFLKTNRKITVRLNGAHSVVVDVLDGFDFGYFMVTTASVTAIDVTNASGSSAAVTVQTAGDLST